MYDTLIMLKPGSSFTVDDLHDLVVTAVAGGSECVERQADLIRVTAGSGWLKIGWNDAPHVLEESNEIAEQLSVPCRGCVIRFEMSGDDPEMDLFNVYLIINKNLQSTGCFVIFDAQEGKLLFDDGA